MQEIAVENLDLGSTHKLVKDLLSAEDDSSLGLAEIAHTRTGGNVFFLTQYLSMLCRQDLLRYNIGTLAWEWDCTEIEKETQVTENVVDLLLRKMEELTDNQRDILRVASCLGHSFDETTLFVVWTVLLQKNGCAERSDDECRGNLHDALDGLMEDGYLHQTGGAGSYSFAHDKVEEASSMLIAVEQRPSFYYFVGKTLLRKLDKTLDSYTFVVSFE